MISIILYVIHFYILPRKVYEGIYCLEEWAYDVATWNATFRTAAFLDIILCLAVAIISVYMIVKTVKKTSSKEEP